MRTLLCIPLKMFQRHALAGSSVNHFIDIDSGCPDTHNIGGKSIDPENASAHKFVVEMLYLRGPQDFRNYPSCEVSGFLGSSALSSCSSISLFVGF